MLVDLALTIYRFLFVMATTLNEMRRAQSWRLGRADYKAGCVRSPCSPAACLCAASIACGGLRRAWKRVAMKGGYGC